MYNYSLFLDDIRTPENAYIYPKVTRENAITNIKSLVDASSIAAEDWVVVRNYKDFVTAIKLLGIPDTVSFDHDLAESHIKHYYEVSSICGVIEYEKLKEKTGKHCAEFLVDMWNKSGRIKNIKTFIHSANIYGVVEIEKTLKQLNND
jgi:hypothetical protein